MNAVVSCDWTAATYLCVQAPNVPHVSICIHNEGYDPDLFIIASINYIWTEGKSTSGNRARDYNSS